MAEAETPEEPPGGLGRRNPEATQLLLHSVSPGNVEIVEALCSEAHRLGHAEDRLGLRQPAIADLEMQVGVDGGAEADRL